MPAVNGCCNGSELKKQKKKIKKLEEDVKKLKEDLEKLINK